MMMMIIIIIIRSTGLVAKVWKPYQANMQTKDSYRWNICGLVVRVSGYRYRGPGFDPRRYQIF